MTPTQKIKDILASRKWRNETAYSTAAAASSGIEYVVRTKKECVYRGVEDAAYRIGWNRFMVANGPRQDLVLERVRAEFVLLTPADLADIQAELAGLEAELEAYKDATGLYMFNGELVQDTPFMTAEEFRREVTEPHEFDARCYSEPEFVAGPRDYSAADEDEIEAAELLLASVRQSPAPIEGRCE